MRHSVQRAATRTDGTRLTLDDGRALQLAAWPDHAGTAQVRAALRRITQVDVSVEGDLVSTSVRGIGHRRQCTLPVAIETALALAVEGCPCSVRLDDAVSDASTTDEELPA